MVETMKRQDIRYALYRCKNNCADEKHLSIFAFYKEELDELGFAAEDFADENGWDISKQDVTKIVTGKTVRKYIKDLLAPTFGLNK